MNVEAEPLEILRHRTSVKWTQYPSEVLPLFVAEMDYPLAPGLSRVLHERIAASDSGYVGSPGELPAVFADFAERRWGWRPGLGGIRTTTDVSVAIVETLRQAIRPGDGVVITTPVYPPFVDFIAEAGGVVVDVPLLGATDRPSGYALDLDGIDRAFAAGARAMLLCHPHNPLGLIHPAEDLEAVAASAARHDVLVISDEIHAPLVHTGQSFTPFLSISDAARAQTVTVTSASKGFNLAGFKCALMIAESERTAALLDAMSFEVGARTSTRASPRSATTRSGSTARSPRSRPRASCWLLCWRRPCRTSATVRRARDSSPGSISAPSVGETTRPAGSWTRRRSPWYPASTSEQRAPASRASTWGARRRCWPRRSSGSR